MAVEYRFAAIEVRAESGEAVEGIAMPYGTEANIAGVFRESVDPGAFGAIGDVVLNRMHVREDLIARTDGGGLRLDDNEERLWLRAEIPAYRADIRDQVQRRILRGFSVEMEVTQEDWPAPDRRIVRAAKLWNVGLVDRSAYGKATAEIAKRAASRCTQARPLPLVV